MAVRCSVEPELVVLVPELDPDPNPDDLARLLAGSADGTGVACAPPVLPSWEYPWRFTTRPCGRGGLAVNTIVTGEPPGYHP